jgi:hypothetical protein
VGGKYGGVGHEDNSRVYKRGFWFRVIVKGGRYDGDLSRDKVLILLDWNSASSLGV